MPGIFIVFEGGEGSGKSTQAKILAEKIKNSFLTHEPGIYRDVIFRKKAHPITELFLFLADRSEHVEEMREKLQHDRIVVCDRFSGATLAYQVGGRGLDEPAVRFMDAYARKGLKPDIVFFCDIDPEKGLKRKFDPKKNLEITHFDEENINFHKAVCKKFQALAKEEGWVMIDAEQSIEKVAEDVVNILQQKFPQLISI